jgi:inositol 1,4,5-triphosphate receptor type 1
LEQIGIAADRQPYTFNYDSLSVYLSQQEKLDDDDLQKIEENIRQYLLSSEIDGRIVLYYTRSSEYKDRNSIIAQMLGVLVFLIDYGFYHNKETKAKEMINILIKILDGSTDSYDRPNSNERDYSSESKIIFKIKTMVLQCLQLFLTRHCYTSLEKLLYDYKVLKSEMAQIRMRSSDKRSIEYLPAMEMLQVAIHTSHSTDVICSLLDPPSPEMRLLINTGVPISQEMTRISRDRLRCNFHNSNYEMFDICMTDSQELCDILMDSINYEDPDICLMSAELLYDMYNVETTLLSSAEKVYLYSNEDDQTLSAMLDISNMTDDDQLLKKMLEHQVDDVPKLLSKLKEFADMCLPENEEPNPYYQGVAYSCGLFNMVLEYVLECGNSNHIEQTEIMSSCCKLLQCIASRNPIAQEKLFNHFQDLMNIKIAVTPAMYLFNEIFVENSSLCDRLTESDIKHFFYFATASCNPEHYELLVTLKTIIRTIKSSTPMQEYIIQLFLEMWEDNLGHIYGLDNKSARIDILMSDDHEPNLILLLNTGDLLARCTEGECQYADSVVSEFFPITDLLEIMTNDKITIIHHKLPFTKILTWTYLNTDRDSLATCSELASSDLFWSHLEDELRVIDDKVINPIKLLSAKQYSLLRRKLRDLYRFNWSIMKWMNFASDLDNGDNFIGNLLYIIKGLIPLLSAFCHETSLHFSGANDICKGFNIPSSLIQQLGDKLAMFHDVLRSTGYHTDLRYCLENVTSLCNALNEAEDDNPDDLNSLESTSETAVREVVTIVHENVSSSIKPIVSMQRHINLTPVHNNDAVRDIVNRNAGFQEYIKRYQQAYSFDHDNEAYDSSDIHENYFTIPKGPSFKKLITLFMDSDEDFKNSKDLKIRKLVIILNTLIHKQNRQEIRSSERAGLERITLLTLQLICGVVFERISRVPREWLPPKEFEQQYDAIIHPIQEMLLGERIVEMLFSMLQYPKDDIAFQVLACLNVLLYPGNEEAQTKISLLVNHHINHELFYRVHQILTGAQSYINREKMGKALAQIAAMSPDGVGELDTPLSERLLRRNKKLLYNQKSTTPPVRSSKKFTKKQKILGTNEFEKAKVAVDNRIIMALNVLSWLCDGQQKELQDMLREQKVLTATNIVSQVTFLLYGIAENLNEGNVNVSQSAVQALIEMCAGNYNNQLIAFKGQVIRSINIILKLKTFSYAIEQFRKLKSSSIELLEIMLEETDEKSSQLAQWIISHLDMTFLLNAMFELFDSQSSSDKWKSSIFRSYHVLRRIADFKNITVDDLVDYKKYTNDCKFAELFKENTDDAKRMWQYCHMWSRSVEIVYKAQSGTELLTRVYFPYDPHKHLNEMEKNTILLHIKRNTPQEKLFDLLQWTQALRKAHAWKKKIKNSWISYMFLWASTVRHFILIFLTLLLNALVLFGLNGPEERVSNISNSSSAPLEYFRPNFMPPSPPWFHPLLYLFGAIHLILAIWMVLQYFVKHWCNISFSMPLVNSIVYDIKKGLLRKKHLYRFMKYMNRVFCSNRIRALRPQTQEHFQTYFFSFEPIYRLVFVLCSLLSLIFSGYFYCGCTLYAFLRNQVLHNILKAVGRSALQLFTVLMLGLVITYMYAVFSFAIMSNDFNTNQDLFCRNIFECFITITRLGFLDTLGLGIPIRPDNDIYPPNFDVLVFRMFYDIFFFIVVTILGLNVVVAILVDRFSEIRDEKERIDADNLNQCFICSIKKDVFERNGKNFQKHYHKDHYMWNYVNFILYLDTIHPNDRNALEKYIAQQVPSKENTAGSIDFFPLFKAKILSGVDILAENYDI